MRLWHIDIVSVLPDTQLIAQWRELNSIFKKQDKHILINYVYNYDKQYLFWYTQVVLHEMRKRNFTIKSWDNYNNYFNNIEPATKPLVYNEHDNSYFLICYYNLKEKYIRGQKDFTKDKWTKIAELFKRRF